MAAHIVAMLLAAAVLRAQAGVTWAQSESVAQPTALPAGIDGPVEMTKPLREGLADVARGRGVAFDPERGNCTICHAIPGSDGTLDGTLGPSLAGTGARHSVGWLRQRLVDGERINPDTIMPSYYRTTGLNRVAPSFQGKTVLSAGEIEDLVAYLASLKGE